MSLLELSGVSKRFGAMLALDKVSVAFMRGEVHCLLGENGAGKSTLCNLIFGVHQPDAGLISLDGQAYAPENPAAALRRGIAMVHQHFSLVPPMTVVENLMLGRARPVLNTAQTLERMRALASEYQIEIDPNLVVEDLSVGERQRVEIIKCLLGNPQLLVLDEPTAVLPPEEIDSFLTICRRIADAGRAVILVTHKLAEIEKVAHRTTVLRLGRVVESVRMDEADMGQLVRSMVGHDIRVSSGVLAATLGIEGTEVAQEPTAAARGSVSDSGVPALRVERLCYRDSAGVARLEDVSLTVRAREIVGIAGVEGNGQSELGAILSGLTAPTSGQIHIGGADVTGASPQQITQCGVGVIPEDRHAVAVVSELSIAENLCLGSTDSFTRFGLLDRSAMKERADALMQEFDIRGSGADASMASLSGGNQQKAVLARELSLTPLTFLLAAQPTRGLDVGAVDAVYGRIQQARDKGLGVLLISSELNELLAVSNRVAVMYRGKIVGEMAADPANREAIGAMMSGRSHA